MVDPTTKELRAFEQFLDDLMTAMHDGLDAARIVVSGGPPDVDVLDKYAQAQETLRVGIAQKRLSMCWIRPTEDDVQSTRRLVQLLRDGAPSEALIEPVQRAARVFTDPWELELFHSALYCLKDEASRIQHLPRIAEVLDRALAFFERGFNVAGFMPTPTDVANVRRLREIASKDGEEALAERQHLVKELLGRLPPGSVVDCMIEWEDKVRSLYLDR